MPWDTNLKRKRKISLKPMKVPKDPREATSLEVSNLETTEYSMALMKAIETMATTRDHSDPTRILSKAKMAMVKGWSRATTPISKENIKREKEREFIIELKFNRTEKAARCIVSVVKYKFEL